MKGLISPLERKNGWSATGGAEQPLGSAQEAMPRPAECGACCTTTWGTLGWFETEPGEQAQVDWGSFAYLDYGLSYGAQLVPGQRGIRQAPASSSVTAFEYAGSHGAAYMTMPRWWFGTRRGGSTGTGGCWTLRLGFELKLCQPYRAQTKGKVESGVKYVRGNLWPSTLHRRRPSPSAVLEWCDIVANRRLPDHPPDSRGDADRRAVSAKLPERSAPYLWHGYTAGRVPLGVHWKWVGATVGGPAVGHCGDLGGRPAPGCSGQRPVIHSPGPVGGLPRTDGRPAREALAFQLPVGEVERRSLEVYDLVAAGGVR